MRPIDVVHANNHLTGPIQDPLLPLRLRRCICNNGLPGDFRQASDHGLFHLQREEAGTMRKQSNAWLGTNRGADESEPVSIPIPPNRRTATHIMSTNCEDDHCCHSTSWREHIQNRRPKPPGAMLSRFVPFYSNIPPPMAPRRAIDESAPFNRCVSGGAGLHHTHSEQGGAAQGDCLGGAT